MNFEERSYELELIDGPVPFDDIKVNLDELHKINGLLGGYNISISALKQLRGPIKGIADIGCGGGHFLLAFRKRFPNADLWGIDLKEECVQYASSLCSGHSIQLRQADFRNVLEMPQIDVVHACLFFHHFKEEDILSFLIEIKRAGKRLIINDLERNILAYWGIRLLSSLFSRSYLVKNDAPLSVRRGFKKREWISLMKQAEISRYSIRNKWAFRHQIIVYEGV